RAGDRLVSRAAAQLWSLHRRPPALSLDLPRQRSGGCCARRGAARVDGVSDLHGAWQVGPAPLAARGTADRHAALARHRVHTLPAASVGLSGGLGEMAGRRRAERSAADTGGEPDAALQSALPAMDGGVAAAAETEWTLLALLEAGGMARHVDEVCRDSSLAV